MSQKYNFQPMKHSDIHYLAPRSAIKNGAANVNPKDVYTNPNKDFLSYKIDTSFLGI
jgi:hypothetical protein